MKIGAQICASLGVLSLTAGLSVAQDKTDWPSSMTVATASPGGAYAIYGQGVATLLSEVLVVPTSTQQTQGPNQNVVLVNRGQADFGMATMGPAFEGWTGALELDPGSEQKDIRAIFPMYQTPFAAIALARSGISSVADLDGRVIGTGPRAGTGGTYWPRWLDLLGIDYTNRNGPVGDQGSQMSDGRLDAIATAGGVPHPTFSELEAKDDVNIFSFSQADIEMILPENAYLSRYSISPEIYKSLEEPLQTVAMWNIFIGNKNLPDDLVYETVKAVFDNHERMLQIHASAMETLAENADQNTVIWYHPGAIRYYREHGIDLPDSVIPPEMSN